MSIDIAPPTAITRLTAAGGVSASVRDATVTTCGAGIVATCDSVPSGHRIQHVCSYESGTQKLHIAQSF